VKQKSKNQILVCANNQSLKIFQTLGYQEENFDEVSRYYVSCSQAVKLGRKLDEDISI